MECIHLLLNMTDRTCLAVIFNSKWNLSGVMVNFVIGVWVNFLEKNILTVPEKYLII